MDCCGEGVRGQSQGVSIVSLCLFPKSERKEKKRKEKERKGKKRKENGMLWENDMECSSTGKGKLVFEYKSDCETILVF